MLTINIHVTTLIIDSINTLTFNYAQRLTEDTNLIKCDFFTGSFQYVKVIRDQLSESRNMSNIPVYVVGNKADLCTSVLNNMRSSHSHHSSHSRYSLYPLTYPRFSGLTLSSFSSSHHHSSWLSTRTQRNTHFNSSSAAQQQQTQNQQPNQQPNQQQTQQQQQTQSSSSSSHHHHHHHHHRLHFHHNHHHWDDLTPAFKELANLVKKQWKCNYLECSAKYNWRIVPIFRDILRLIEINQSKCLDHSANYISGDLDYHRDSIKFSLTSTTLNQPTSNNQLVTTSSTTNPIVTISTLSPTINDRTSTINDSNNNTNHQSCIIL